jgi:hypothetical protein
MLLPTLQYCNTAHNTYIAVGPAYIGSRSFYFLACCEQTSEQLLEFCSTRLWKVGKNLLGQERMDGIHDGTVHTRVTLSSGSRTQATYSLWS